MPRRDWEVGGVRAGLEMRPGFWVEGRREDWREVRRARFVAEVSHWKMDVSVWVCLREEERGRAVACSGAMDKNLLLLLKHLRALCYPCPTGATAPER